MGSVCFVISNPCVLSANRVDLGCFCFRNFPILLPPPSPLKVWRHRSLRGLAPSGKWSKTPKVVGWRVEVKQSLTILEIGDWHSLPVPILPNQGRAFPTLLISVVLGGNHVTLSQEDALFVLSPADFSVRVGPGLALWGLCSQALPRLFVPLPY